MLPFPGAKSTRKEDISSILFEAIVQERGDSTAAGLVRTCRAVQELRAVVTEPPTTKEIRTGLLAYLAALKYFKSKLPLSNPLDQELLWASGFDANATRSVANLDFDYVSVLFNVGVCEAHLGTDEQRQKDVSSDALVRAASHFLYAASAFKTAAAVPTPGGIREITSDLLPEALAACEMLMLGNAQQLLYLHAKDQNPEEKFYHKINARYAAGASHYYRCVADKCAEPSLVNTPINAAIGAPSAALAAYFSALAELSQAQICEKHCKIAEQLTRLINAKNACDLATSRGKQVHASTVPYLQPLQSAILSATETLSQDIRERQAKADEENRYVYHGIDPEKDVPRIAIREAIPKDIQLVIDGITVDPRLHALDNLPEPSPSELMGTSSKYAALVAKTVGAEIAALNTAASHLRETLVQAESALARAASVKQRPQSVPHETTSAEDQKAIDAVSSAKKHGGLQSLRDSYSLAISCAHEARSQIREIEAMLANEETEDRQLRARVQTLRTDSRSAAHDFYAKLAKSKSDLEKAANADSVVESQLSHHGTDLQALDTVNVDGLHPPSGTAQPSVSNSAVQSLTSMVTSAKNVLSEKDMAIQDFENKKHLENPISASARITSGKNESAQLDALVRSNYGALQNRSKLLCERMDVFTSKIASERAQLSLGSGRDPHADEVQRRMATVFRHQAAAVKFEELRNFLAQGLQFYTREQDSLKALRAEVDAFVQRRHAEASQIMPHITPHGVPPQYGMPQQYGMPPEGLQPQHHPYRPSYLTQPPPPPPPGSQSYASSTQSNTYWHSQQPPQDPR